MGESFSQNEKYGPGRDIRQNCNRCWCPGHVIGHVLVTSPVSARPGLLPVPLLPGIQRSCVPFGFGLSAALAEEAIPLRSLSRSVETCVGRIIILRGRPSVIMGGQECGNEGERIGPQESSALKLNFASRC